MTSNSAKGYSSEYPCSHIFLPTKPVSASRPRVSKWGSYYSKSYMTYRKDAHAFFKKIAKKYPQQEGIFEVELEFIIYKPKQPSDELSPRYDIDNLEKAVIDAMTHEKMFWTDDVKIVSLRSIKRYQEEGEAYGTNIKVRKIEADFKSLKGILRKILSLF